MIRSWADLLDQTHAELVFAVRCAGVNFREHLAEFDFSPFVELTPDTSSRDDLDLGEARYLVASSRFEELRRGVPCPSYVTITVSDVELELAARDLGAFEDEHALTMKLLRSLTKEEDRPWRWTGFSRDPTSGRNSEHRQGVLVVALPPE